MIDDESPPGSWKQALEWKKQMENDALMADRPNAEDWRNRAERAEAECLELRAKLDRIYYILKEY